MRFISAILALFICAATSLTAEEATILTIHFENVSSKGGSVMVALYDKETNWLKEQILDAKSEAVSPGTSVTFTNLPKGEYAVSVFQDENNNQMLDCGFMGIPQEPYGFSNDAPVYFGPPKWDKAVFSINNGENEIVIHL